MSFGYGRMINDFLIWLLGSSLSKIGGMMFDN